MNAISTITGMPKTSQEIDVYVSRVKSDIMEGYVNGLETATLLKSLEEIVKRLKNDEDIKDMILQEAEKYQEKTIELNGCKFTKRSSTRYSYSGCGDSKYNELKAKASMITEELKGREKFLKSLTDVYVDSETGETIMPPAKISSEVVAVTLSKK